MEKVAQFLDDWLRGGASVDDCDDTARELLDLIGLKEGFAVRRRGPTQAMVDAAGDSQTWKHIVRNVWLTMFDHPSAAPDGKEGT